MPSLFPVFIQWRLFKFYPLSIKFPVRSNSITYIGCIEFTRLESSYRLDIKDEKAEMTKELESKYPNIREKLKDMQTDITNLGSASESATFHYQ